MSQNAFTMNKESQCITEEQLCSIYRKLTPVQRAKVMDNYGFLMDDNQSVETNIKTVICLIPEAYKYPHEVLVKQLVLGPAIKIAADSEHSLKTLAYEILQNIDKFKIDMMCKFARSYMRCPAEYKTEFYCLVDLMQYAIDIFKLNIDYLSYDDMVEYLWDMVLEDGR